MVKIWKIGARPGLWKKNPQSRKEEPREDKVEKEKRFINNYALCNDFVAIGNAWVKGNLRVLIETNKLDNAIKEGFLENYKVAISDNGARKSMLTDFANIDDGDVILLYFIGEEPKKGKVYVGKASKEKNPYDYANKVKTPYYHVKRKSKEDVIEGTIGIHIAPHRVAVNWDFRDGGLEFKKGKCFPASFTGGKYMRRICQVLKKDLEKTIKSEKLIEFLERKLKE
jgi:hypothetical protein